MNIYPLFVSSEDPRIGEALERVTKILDAEGSYDRYPPTPISTTLARLNQHSSPELCNTLVVLDLTSRTDAFYADPLGLAAEMVLSFPEVTWVCIGYGENPPCENEDLARRWCHHAYVPLEDVFQGLGRRMEKHAGGFRTLFDPYGLRAHLKHLISSAHREFEGKEVGGATDVEVRRAAVIDDETSYAYLGAYVAYRSNFSTTPIVSLRTLYDVAGASVERPDDEGGGEARPEEGLDLTIQDVQLCFGDDSPVTRQELWGAEVAGSDEKVAALEQALGGGHGSIDEVLKERKRWFPALAGSGRTILLSRLSLADARSGGNTRIVEKPFAGIHALSSVIEGLASQGKQTDNATGDASPVAQLENAAVMARHTAPSPFQRPVRRLLARCRRVCDEPGGGVERYVHGALLALEARSLLSTTVLTTGLEALELQHSCEVESECCFQGVSGPHHVASRVAELEREVRKAVGEARKAPQKKQVWSALARILHKLRGIYAHAGRYEAETQCLHQLRKAVRNDRYWGARVKLYEGAGLRIGAWLRSVVAFFQRLGSWYFSLGVRSLTAAIGLLLLWVGVFMIVFWAGHDYIWYESLPGGEHKIGAWKSFLSIIQSLLSLDPQKQCACATLPPWAQITMLLVAVTGYLHLGLLISLIYQWITRR